MKPHNTHHYIAADTLLMLTKKITYQLKYFKFITNVGLP